MFIKIFFGLDSWWIYSSVMFERHIFKNTGLFRNSLTLISIGGKWCDEPYLSSYGGRWPLRPRTDGYQPIDSTTGSAFVWLVVNVIPIPKDQDNPWRFCFYYLFTDITYKFEYRSSSHYSPNCLSSGETIFQSTCINRAGNKNKINLLHY